MTEQLEGVIVERDVPMLTRDGVRLVSDVYRPAADGRHPTLVVRTPYGRQVPLSSSLRDAEFFSRHGYVVVHQDTRGRGDSEGTFYPFLTEGVDTYDTIEWAATLPWSNGDVGTVGQSYMAIVQYLVAPLQPPHLRAMVPVAGPIDMFDHCVYRGGAFELQWMLNYFTMLELVTYQRMGRPADVERLLSYRGTGNGTAGSPAGLRLEAYEHLPLADWPSRLCGDVPYVREMMEHTVDGPYWWAMDASRQIDRFAVPVFNISSWYDIFLEASLLAYPESVSRSGTSGATGHRLLVGPWAHLGSPNPYSVPTTGGAGDYDFGPAAAVELHKVQLRWLDRIMKPSAPHEPEEAPVRIFVMGRNEWRDEHEWPLARALPVAMYLGSGGRANSRHGDGTLHTEPPSDGADTDSYVYDPSSPTPTAGGPMGGIQDQRVVEDRPDVLVYTSDVLTAPIEVTGPVRLELWAASSAPDTDFVAKLVDVRPDGYAHNLVDGVIRARFRESMTEPQPLTPGEVYRFDIKMRATSFVFDTGHRIRLEISSSNFPRFDRNLNVWPSSLADADAAVATQVVHHSPAHPSALHVCVVPAD